VKQQVSESEITWAMVCHLAGLIWIPLYWLGFALPAVNIAIPGLIWLWKRPSSSYIDFQGREAVNFNIALCVYGLMLFLVGTILFFIYLAIFGATIEDSAGAIETVFSGIESVAGVVAAIATLWSLGLAITAAWKTKQGQVYVYPLTWRFLKPSQDGKFKQKR